LALGPNYFRRALAIVRQVRAVLIGARQLLRLQGDLHFAGTIDGGPPALIEAGAHPARVDIIAEKTLIFDGQANLRRAALDWRVLVF
jgi:hypothetical protein